MTTTRQFLIFTGGRKLDYTKNANAYQKLAMVAGMENGWIVVPPGYEGFAKDEFGAKAIASNDPRIDAKNALYCRGVSNETTMLAALRDRLFRHRRYVALFWDPPGVTRRDDPRLLMRLRCCVMDALMELVMRFSEATVMNLHPGFLEGRFSAKALAKVKVFPNGTMVAANQQAAKDVVRRPKRISISSGFTASKGCWELVELIKRLWTREPETEFLWVGTGPDSDEVVRRLREAGCEGPRLILTGGIPLQESMRLQASCQIGVCLYRDVPSLRWNYVLKAPEALSLGLPLFAWRLPGISEYVKDGETGFLLDEGRIDELADKICALLNDPARLQRMREACLRRAQDYDWNRVNDEIRLIFAEKFGILSANHF
jgi:glycosyltransferase involved in cell wall biosynthesis